MEKTILDELREILLKCPIENALDLRVTCSIDGFKSNLKFKYGMYGLKQKKYPTLIESLEKTFNAFYDRVAFILKEYQDQTDDDPQDQETSDLLNTISLCQTAIQKKL